MCCVHLPTPYHPLCRSSIHLASATGARLLYEYVVGKMREAHFPHNILPHWLRSIIDRWCVVGSERRGTDFPHNTTYSLAGSVASWIDGALWGAKGAGQIFPITQHTSSLARLCGIIERWCVVGSERRCAPFAPHNTPSLWRAPQARANDGIGNQTPSRKKNKKYAKRLT